MPLPPKDQLTIQFAHPAYQFADEFESRATGIKWFKTNDRDETRARIGETDVLVISGLWDNSYLDVAPKLRFIQGNASGYDHFDLAALKSQGVKLANARGVNANAVSEQALGLMIALSRGFHLLRDAQHDHHWRPMFGNPLERERELPGKTLFLFGLGAIGGRVARLAKAFDMKVVGFRRNTGEPVDGVDELLPPAAFKERIGEADYVVLTCPLTDETRNLVGAAELAAMKSDAYLVNLARGKCIDEPALIDAMGRDAIAGAALDTFWAEPLDPKSPLWDMKNVIITPHTGGETERYEANVIDLLLTNLDSLWSGAPMTNEIV